MNKKYIVLASILGFIIGAVLTGIIFIYALPEHVGDLKEMESISKETGYSIIKNPEGPTNYLVISPLNEKDKTIVGGLMVNNMAQINNLNSDDDTKKKITFKTLFGYIFATNLIINDFIQNSDISEITETMTEEDRKIIEQFKKLDPILFEVYNSLKKGYE